MNLQIGPSIDQKKVRLDFRNSPYKPYNMPSYEIEKNKADEFVQKYNEQERKLVHTTMLSVALFAVVGWLSSLHKTSWVRALFYVPGGVMIGLGLGAMFSSHKKNSLMDKYDVKEVSYN